MGISNRGHCPRSPRALALTVAYAGYLLSRPDAGAGVELLVEGLRTPGVSGAVEADARRLLRGQWRQHPNAVEEAWQSAEHQPRARLDATSPTTTSAR